MAHLNARGDVCGGIAGSDVWCALLGQSAHELAEGSNVAGFFDDDHVLYQDVDNHVAIVDIQTGVSAVVFAEPLLWGEAAGGQWAVALVGPDPRVEMSVPGGPLRGGPTPLTVALDGTVIILDDYQAGQGITCYAPDGTVRHLPTARPMRGAGFWLDGHRGVYFDTGAGRWVGDGVPDPIFVPDAGVMVDAWIADVLGTLYVGYHTGDDRYLVHELTNPSSGWVVATGYTNYTRGQAIPDTTILRCAWGSNASESGSDGLQHAELDTTSAMADLTVVPPPAPPAAVVPTLAPFTHPVAVACFSPRTPDISTVPLDQLGHFTESLTDAVWTAPADDLPLLDCDDGNPGDVFPPIPTAPNGDRVEAAPELYLGADTSDAGIAASIAGWRAKIADLLSRPGVTAISPVVMLYCQSAAPAAAQPGAGVNEKWTEQTILDLWPVYIDLVNSDPRISSLEIFADVRANGVSGHPVFDQLLQQVVANSQVSLAAAPPTPSANEITVLDNQLRGQS